MVWCPGESGDQSVSCVEIGTKVVVEPGENSPCSVAWWWNREKILPAREKWPDFGVFGRAGRVLYRLGQGVGVAGRVLYRLSPGVAVAGRVLYRVSGGLVLEAGENSPCSREMAGFRCFWACWESFVPVGPGGGCCWESFVPVEPGGGCCWESFVPGEWWIGVGSGRKFSLLARNGRISVFLGVLGEFCTG